MRNAFLPAGLALAAVAPAAAQELSLVQLDPGGQLAGGFVVDVATDGRAVGSGIPAGFVWPQPVVLSPSTGVQVLPVLSGAVMGEANAINGGGAIAGASTVVQQSGSLTFFFDTAVTWDAAGAITDLRAAATGGAALELFRAWDVNDAGQVVGFGRDPAIPAGRGFLWDNGTVIELPPLPGVPVSRMTQAYGINDSAQVVGFAEDAGGFEHAVRFEGGVLTDLHSLAGIAGRTSKAWDVNEAGWVAGSADFVGDFIDWRVAAVWRPDGSVIELGTLGGTVAIAYSINDDNAAVGNAALDGGGIRAFLWRDGVLVDLNELIHPSLGFTVVEARSISNDGRIVGLASDGVALHPVELVPKPCGGFFQLYGEGCAGSGDFTPNLAGFGCPAPGEELLLGISQGLGGASGFLVVGAGQGTFPITPSCDLQVLPLLPTLVPIALSGTGPGQGQLQLEVAIAPGTPPFDLFLQAVFLDPGVPDLVASSRPLWVHGQ